jgi:hypothetical protein
VGCGLAGDRSVKEAWLDFTQRSVGRLSGQVCIALLFSTLKKFILINLMVIE